MYRHSHPVLFGPPCIYILKERFFSQRSSLCIAPHARVRIFVFFAELSKEQIKIVLTCMIEYPYIGALKINQQTAPVGTLYATVYTSIVLTRKLVKTWYPLHFTGYFGDISGYFLYTEERRHVRNCSKIVKLKIIGIN